jgi:hypothetical protein
MALPARAAECTAPAAWFPHNQTPPPDSKNFPSDPNNCDFHQWSWNTFLWLTQDVNGAPRFQSMPADGIETPPGVADPLIGRAPKAREIRIIDQAGPDGILVDQSGHAVYYTIHSDSIFGDFITQNGLLDPTTLRAFDPKTPFPVGSLTLKAAWKIVNPGEDVSTFYTRQAEVALLTEKNGKITVALDENGKPKTKTMQLALVGFHIAGTVTGHPEMIWATFEHMRNAPDLPEPMDKMKPDATVSDKAWTFYKKDTKFKDCNVNSAGAGALKLDEQAQTLSPVTEVCRMVAYGGGKSSNVANIVTINKSVHAQLKDLWKNYFEVGAIWFSSPDALEPNCTFQPGALECPAEKGQPILTGSTHLSNTTVETFTQTQSTQDNCFACHNTVQVSATNPTMQSLPGLDVDISHVLINQYFEAQAPKQ